MTRQALPCVCPEEQRHRDEADAKLREVAKLIADAGDASRAGRVAASIALFAESVKRGLEATQCAAKAHAARNAWLRREAERASGAVN